MHFTCNGLADDTPPVGPCLWVRVNRVVMLTNYWFFLKETTCSAQQHLQWHDCFVPAIKTNRPHLTTINVKESAHKEVQVSVPQFDLGSIRWNEVPEKNNVPKDLASCRWFPTRDIGCWSIIRTVMFVVEICKRHENEISPTSRILIRDYIRWHVVIQDHLISIIRRDHSTC